MVLHCNLNLKAGYFGRERTTGLPSQPSLTPNCDLVCQITDPPDYIKRSAAKTIGWLRATLRNAKGYYSMKLMLVGRAEQGKTTLMKRLMYEYNYNTNSPTNGIVSVGRYLRHLSLAFRFLENAGFTQTLNKQFSKYTIKDSYTGKKFNIHVQQLIK